MNLKTIKPLETLMKTVPYVLMLGVVLLSGCITIEFDHEFRADGSSKLVQTIDFTKTVGAMQSLGNNIPEQTSERFDWNVTLRYAPNEMDHTSDFGSCSGYLNENEESIRQGTCRNFQVFRSMNVQAMVPEAGGELSFELVNIGAGDFDIIEVEVSGDGAPASCEAPGMISEGESGEVRCMGITRPLPSPTPDASEALAQFQEQLDAMCVNLTTKNPDAECEHAGNKIIASMELENGNGYSFTYTLGFPYNAYEVEVESIQSSSSDMPQQDGSPSVPGLSTDELRFKDEKLAASVAMLSAGGIEMTYTVRMPGEIAEAPRAQIIENAAEFDLMEMIEKGENPKVKSRELNLPFVAGAAGLLLVLLIVVFFFVVKKPPQPSSRIKASTPYPPSSPVDEPPNKYKSVLETWNQNERKPPN
ncbi:hypothetical protein KJ765_00310 [Candidatus Micrarchaeota archaeon]|nr:hypothetical protein [Candidatus Micrarchaeota archaeon]